MTKGDLTEELATEYCLEQDACAKVISSFVAIVAQEAKKNGVFNVPEVCRTRPAQSQPPSGCEGDVWQGDQGNGKCLFQDTEGKEKNRR